MRRTRDARTDGLSKQLTCAETKQTNLARPLSFKNFFSPFFSSDAIHSLFDVRARGKSAREEREEREREEREREKREREALAQLVVFFFLKRSEAHVEWSGVEWDGDYDDRGRARRCPSNEC